MTKELGFVAQFPMRRHLGLALLMLSWAENALAHGGELLLVIVGALALPLAILLICLARWRASATHKAVVLLAYFACYPVLILVSPVIDAMRLELAMAVLLLALPLVVSLVVAWALRRET
jgi:hypothetical protein